MTNEEIVLVKKTWWMVRGFNPLVLGDSFYCKLFSEKPSLRRIFPATIKELSKKLFDPLDLIIARLDQPELEEELEVLARIHRQYGLTSSHYKAVREAMLWTAEKALGIDYTPEILKAWKSCYNSIVKRTIAVAEAYAK